MDVFEDLVAEQDRLEGILSGYDEERWDEPSAAPGWSVADVVLHLAQTEEAIVISASADGPPAIWSDGDEAVDDLAARMVSDERATGQQVFERWRTARRAAVATLRATDPDRPLRWARAPLRPRTLATTRIAEHWAHGLDVTEPFGVAFPDTGRLRHVAWLGHSTLPYAFGLIDEEPHPVHCELIGADGETWQFGPPDAVSTISGAAGAFCRVGAQRLAPDESGLSTSGPHAQLALQVLRNYAA
jgi:uncharacterized protein (TIGR03084 family)